MVIRDLLRDRRVAACLAVVAAVGLSACAATRHADGEGAHGPADAPVPLTADSLPAWREYILPSADDMAYASIPWHVTFGEGMDAARSEGKPLLMWAMNGHPLGCT